MSENGKGDDSRPFSVPKKVYYDNYERTFGKKTAQYECEYSGLPSVNAYEEKEKVNE